MPLPSLLAAALLLAPLPAPERERDNVAAFARLYGVVRFFYPSDAAAALDWDRFAEAGVSLVRPARDAGELATALRRLVAPLGPGIEVSPALGPARGSQAVGPLDAKDIGAPCVTTGSRSLAQNDSSLAFDDDSWQLAAMSASAERILLHLGRSVRRPIEPREP